MTNQDNGSLTPSQQYDNALKEIKERLNDEYADHRQVEQDRQAAMSTFRQQLGEKYLPGISTHVADQTYKYADNAAQDRCGSPESIEEFYAYYAELVKFATLHHATT